MANEQIPSTNTYKLRTMEHDKEAAKRGSLPTDLPVKVEQQTAQPIAKDVLGQEEQALSPRAQVITPPELDTSVVEQKTPPPHSRPVGPFPAQPQQGRQNTEPVNFRAEKPPQSPPVPSGFTAKDPISHAFGKPPVSGVNIKQKETPKEPVTKLAAPPARNLGRTALLALVAVVILGVIGFEVWYFFIRPEPSVPVGTQTPEDILPTPEDTLPSPVEPTEQPEPATPGEALIAYDRTETITVDSTASGSIAKGIAEIVSLPAPEGEILYAEIKIESGDVTRPATLAELTNSLSISIPQTVTTHLGDSINIYVVSRNVFDESTCKSSGISSATCYGPRLVLVAEVENAETLTQALRSWEQNMSQDLRSLILADVTVSTGEFLDATYRGVPVRYRNFPIDTMTIDYAVVNDLFIVATSKSAMFAAIDALP